MSERPRTNQVTYGDVHVKSHKVSEAGGWLLSGSITFAVKVKDNTQSLTFDFTDAATEKEAIERLRCSLRLRPMH